MELHPLYKAMVDAYAEAGRPFFHQVSPEQGRAMMRETIAAVPKPSDLPELEKVENFAIDGQHGPIPVRSYQPKGEAAGTCVYFHAGGWVLGDLDLSDNTCRRLAGRAGCRVISVEYRKAPEHPYPAPLDDCWAALIWAAEEFAGPLVVMGESAGGNLAAACAIKARDEAFPALAGQMLVYPVTDHDFETGSYREVGGKNWLLSTADMEFYWDQYCPAGVDRDQPSVSPMRIANAEGLAPALVIVAGLDPLRDEGLAYAAKIACDGVQVSTRCDPGMAHGYLSAAGAIPEAKEALDDAVHWMRRRFEAAGGRSS